MKKVLIVFLLLVSHEGESQTVVQTVQEAIQLARQQNPDLKIARQNRIGSPPAPA